MTDPKELAKEIAKAAKMQSAPTAWRKALEAAILSALTAYGAECAARERERCARLFGVSASMLVDPIDSALGAVLDQFKP